MLKLILSGDLPYLYNDNSPQAYPSVYVYQYVKDRASRMQSQARLSSVEAQPMFEAQLQRAPQPSDCECKVMPFLWKKKGKWFVRNWHTSKYKFVQVLHKFLYKFGHKKRNRQVPIPYI